MRIIKGAMLIATCALLMGFPKVSRVQGAVVGRTGNFLVALFGRPKQLAVDDSPTPYLWIKVADGASVTLRENGCELKFSRSFLMPPKLGACRRNKDRDDKDQRQEQDQGSSSQQQSASSQSTTSSTASSTTASSTTAASSAGGLTTLQATLVSIGSAAVAKKAYDEIKDKPVSP